MQINRSEVNQALAKALAYQACGKPVEAERWAAHLVELLECAAILSPGGRAAAMHLTQREG